MSIPFDQEALRDLRHQPTSPASSRATPHIPPAYVPPPELRKPFPQPATFSPRHLHASKFFLAFGGLGVSSNECNHVCMCIHSIEAFEIHACIKLEMCTINIPEESLYNANLFRQSQGRSYNSSPRCILSVGVLSVGSTIRWMCWMKIGTYKPPWGCA